jgi:hypothetical protein
MAGLGVPGAGIGETSVRREQRLAKARGRVEVRGRGYWEQFSLHIYSLWCGE